MGVSAPSPMRSSSSCSTRPARGGVASRMRAPRQPIDYDSALGRRIVELHIWAVSEGLRGTAADQFFDGFCQRLVIAGLPLWRGYAAMNTLHPQWGGYSYTWRRDINAIEPGQFERALYRERDWFDSPFAYLLNQ